MQAESEDVFGGAEREQARAEQRSARQVEHLAGDGRQARAQCGLAVLSRRARHGFPRQREPAAGVDALHGLTVFDAERRAEALVTRDERVQGALERDGVERAVETERGRNGVRGAARVERVEQPQTALRERCGKGGLGLGH